MPPVRQAETVVGVQIDVHYSGVTAQVRLGYLDRAGQRVGAGHIHVHGNILFHYGEIQLVIAGKLDVFGELAFQHHQDSDPAAPVHDTGHGFLQPALQKGVAALGGMELFIIQKVLENVGGRGAADGQRVSVPENVGHVQNAIPVFHNFFGIFQKIPSLVGGGQAGGRADEHGIADLALHVFDDTAQV